MGWKISLIACGENMKVLRSEQGKKVSEWTGEIEIGSMGGNTRSFKQTLNLLLIRDGWKQSEKYGGVREFLFQKNKDKL